jgi:H+/Cl- antiporter ClcA
MMWYITCGWPSAAGAIAAASEPLRRRRLGLIAAGSAAGISAGFGAPIAGRCLHSSTFRLNISTFYRIRWVLFFPQSIRQGVTGRCDQNG